MARRAPGGGGGGWGPVPPDVRALGLPAAGGFHVASSGRLMVGIGPCRAAIPVVGRIAALAEAAARAFRLAEWGGGPSGWLPRGPGSEARRLRHPHGAGRGSPLSSSVCSLVGEPRGEIRRDEVDGRPRGHRRFGGSWPVRAWRGRLEVGFFGAGRPSSPAMRRRGRSLHISFDIRRRVCRPLSSINHTAACSIASGGQGAPRPSSKHIWRVISHDDRLGLDADSRNIRRSTRCRRRRHRANRDPPAVWPRASSSRYSLEEYRSRQGPGSIPNAAIAGRSRATNASWTCRPGIGALGSVISAGTL